MDTKKALKNSLKSNRGILSMYIEDLTNEDFMLRVLPNSNHIAWQLGHLICSERGLMEFVKPGASPELPAGFAQRHSKETAALNDASAFDKKETYIELLEKQRAASLKILDELSDTDLDKPGFPPMIKVVPTVGDIFILLASHDMMHAGQFILVRRKLNKAVMM